MKKLLFAFCLCVSYFTWADMPGNKPRAGVNFKFTNTAHFNAYNFFIEKGRTEKLDSLVDNTMYIANEGYGAPRSAFIYGVNKKTQIHTDTFHISAWEGSLIFNLDTVQNNKLIFSEKALPQTMQTESERTVIKKEHKIDGVNMILLISLAGIGLMGLIAFFVMKKNS